MEFTVMLAGRLRAVERMIHDAADLLEKEIENAIGKTGHYNPEYSDSGGNSP